MLKPIAKSQIIFSIPEHLFITVDNSRAHKILKNIFSDVSIWSILSDSPDLILAIRLIYEKLQIDSPWKPFLDLLPENYTATIFWNEKDLEQLKEGNLYQITNMHKKQIKLEYQKIKNLICKKFVQIFPPNLFSEDRYFWALGTIWSRALDITVGGIQKRVLVPLLDMFNHDFSSHIKHTFNPLKKQFEAETETELEPGSQIFLNYGPMGNSKLLHLYGFTVDQNPYDYIQLFLSMSPQAELYEKKKELLEKRGLSTNPDFYIKKNDLQQFPIEILGCVRIQRLTETDLARNSYAFDEEEIISEENEVFSLKSLEEGFKSMFLAYKFDYESDIQIYTRYKNGENFDRNYLNALIIRLGDREVLAKAAGLIIEKIKLIQKYLTDKINSGNTTSLVPEF